MILAIIQARMSSTRFPGKVLKTILGTPMLMLQVERIKHSKRIDQILIATSTDASDDPIQAVCREKDVECFRGDLNDVLERFYQAAKPINPEHIVRLTGDCPLSDPEVIDETIDFYLNQKVDYASNLFEPTFPDGLEVEIFRFKCLEKAWKEAKLPSEREHVTPFLYNHKEKFKVAAFKNEQDLSHFRWTVDEPVDYELIQKIFEALYKKSEVFHMREILSFLERNPKLKNINTHHQRNEGYQRSLAADKAAAQKESGRA